MNTVWVLVAFLYSGHFGYGVVPTMEFKTQGQCELAAKTITADAAAVNFAKPNFRCVRIER